MGVSALPKGSDAGRFAPAKPADPARARVFPLWRMSAAIVCMLGLPAAADAAFIPPDLPGGSAYRLIFTTSTWTAGQSSNIDDYNAVVNSAAALNPSLPSVTWAAIVSTSSTSALANLAGACSTTACLNAPIYLVDGTTLVAATQAALFSGAISHAITENENGGTLSLKVWTGSNADGSIASGYALGSAGPEKGDPTKADQAWLAAGTASDNASGFSLYAISGQLMVPAPEPMSGALLLTGGVAVGLVRRLRRRQPAV